MGFIEEWLEDVKAGKVPAYEPEKKEVEAVDKVDRWDRQDYNRIAKEMKDFRIARDQLCDVADTGSPLFSDTFHAFMKIDPQLKDEGRMRPSHLINRAVMDEILKFPEYERLRTWTEGDIIGSAAATIALEPDLETIYDRTKKQQEEAAALEKQMMEYAAAAGFKRDLDEMVEQWSQMDDFDPEAAAAAQQQAQDALDGMAQALCEAGQSLEEGIKDGVHSAAVGMRQTLGEAAEDAESTQNQARAWGMDPGELKRMDASERIQLAQRLNNPKFARIAELWGPMSREANTEQKRKIYHSFEEVYDISTGNDLNRVLPMEFANLRHPLLKRDFYRRFTEGKLLQYEMRGEEKVGKGGIIMCLDNSGSMSGDPEMWAKAVGLCALHIAREQKRSFYGIHFGSSYELQTFDFRNPQDIAVDRVMDYAEFFFGGGTDFMRPLTEALAILNEEYEEKGFVEGDIVFVTDGICSVTPDWLKDFKEKQAEMGFKVWGILIGSPYQRDGEPLKTICDGNVTTITDLLSGNEVRGMFRDL